MLWPTRAVGETCAIVVVTEVDPLDVLSLLAVAVIVAEPDDTAVSTPVFALIVTTPVLELDQVTLELVTGLPPASVLPAAT